MLVEASKWVLGDPYIHPLVEAFYQTVHARDLQARAANQRRLRRLVSKETWRFMSALKSARALVRVLVLCIIALFPDSHRVGEL